MSFLDKLKKGMESQMAENSTAAGKEIGNEQIADGTPGEGAAVFAAYKTGSGKGIPSLKEASAAKRTKPRGQTKKITDETDANEETDDREQPSGSEIIAEETTKAGKKSPDKPMAKKIAQSAESKKEAEWLNGEGQLTVDVYQTEEDLVVQSAIAGIKVEDLDVLIEDDLITIKGNRPNPLQENGDYFIEECYWGQFSRKIILPVEVDSSRADAAMKDGILTIRIPKIQREKKKKVLVKQ